MTPNRKTFQPEDFFKLEKETDQLKFLLNFAMLAPSSHNTQPWLFKVRGLTIELWANKEKILDASDQDHRQLFISLGCALENLLIAADYYGWPVKTELFPDPMQELLAARITFEGPHYSANQVDHFPHLFFAIPERHTNRNLYESKSVPEDFIEKIKRLEASGLKIFVTQEMSEGAKLINIVGNATESAFSDPGFKKELSRWMKPSLGKYKEGMPGYNLGVPWPMSFLVPFFIKNLDVRKQQRKMAEDWLRATPAFVIITTETNDPADWIKAGQTYERIALMATAAGLKTAVLAAPIQIGSFYQELQQMLTTIFRPQVFFRLGYSSKVPKFSPRRSVEECLMAN